MKSSFRSAAVTALVAVRTHSRARERRSVGAWEIKVFMGHRGLWVTDSIVVLTGRFVAGRSIGLFVMGIRSVLSLLNHPPDVRHAEFLEPGFNIRKVD